MRFTVKLYLCVLCILTSALSMTRYLVVSSSLTASLDASVTAALQLQRTCQYAIRADLLTAMLDGTLETAGDAKALSEQTCKDLLPNARLKFCQESEVSDTIFYSITGPRGQEELEIRSSFAQGDLFFQMESHTSLNEIYSSAEALDTRCERIFLITELGCALLSLLLSVLLTVPLRKLRRAARAYGEGNFKARVTARSHDEFGVLAAAYNQMADSIEDRIQELKAVNRRQEDFVANFAHELKTPMTGIIGYADLLSNGLPDEAATKEAADYILNEALRLEALSFKLMDLITLGRQDFLLEEAEVSELLQDAGMALAPAAEKRGVSFFVSADTGWIRAEYDLFKTLLLNLCDNAFKSGAKTVLLQGKMTAAGYRVRVIDNGRGIPEQELTRLTEAFYMVDKARSRKEHGAGLGLALCERIAAIHGSGLHFDSKVGKGTAVTLLLPILEEVEE